MNKTRESICSKVPVGRSTRAVSRIREEGIIATYAMCSLRTGSKSEHKQHTHVKTWHHFLNHKETKGMRKNRKIPFHSQTNALLPSSNPTSLHGLLSMIIYVTSCPSIIDQALEIRESNPGLGSITSSSASGSFLKVAYSSWFEHVGKKSWTHDDITRVFGWSSCSQATNIKEKWIKVCPSQNTDTAGPRHLIESPTKLSPSLSPWDAAWVHSCLSKSNSSRHSWSVPVKPWIEHEPAIPAHISNGEIDLTALHTSSPLKRNSWKHALHSCSLISLLGMNNIAHLCRDVLNAFEETCELCKRPHLRCAQVAWSTGVQGIKHWLDQGRTITSWLVIALMAVWRLRWIWATYFTHVIPQTTITI